MELQMPMNSFIPDPDSRFIIPDFDKRSGLVQQLLMRENELLQKIRLLSMPWWKRVFKKK